MSMEGIPSVAFLIPKKTPRDTQLVGFHLYLPMGKIDIAPYFCIVTEMMADLSNKTISQREQTGNHPLELASENRSANNTSAPETQADAS